MQCPTCGRDTPGTLNRCVRCDAPVIQQPQETPVHEPQTQRFEPAHEPSADPQGGPAAPAQRSPEPWTSDSDAIARWAATPAFSNQPESWPASPPSPAQPPAPASPPGTSGSLDDWYTKPPPRPTPPQAPAPQAAPAPGVAPHRAEPDATQAWSMEPTPKPTSTSGPAWPGADDQTPHETRPAESIVPDSWFTGPPRPAEPEATERWTPEPGPADADPWAANQPPPGPSQPWGPEPHGGQAWGPEPHGGGQAWGPDQHGGHAWGPEQHGGQAWGPEMHGGQGYPQRNETAVLGADFPPGQGPGYGPMEPHRGRAGKPLIVVVTALVIAAVVAVAVVMWPKGEGTSSGGPTPAAAKSPADDAAARPQATAINSLLNASAASRGELGRALTAAKLCKGLPAAIAGMQRVAKERQQQLSRTRALKVDALPNGTQLRGHLGKAIQYSLEVDQAYLAWAQSENQNTKTCQRAGGAGPKRRPRPDANYQRGGQLSNQASVSKKRFATLWAPVARKHHLPARTANQF